MLSPVITSLRLLSLVLYFLTTAGQFIFEDQPNLRVGSECIAEGNLAGVCTKASHCPRAKLNASSTKICAFEGVEAIVCCVRTSHLVCRNFWNLFGNETEIINPTLFVGGVRAKSLEYLHMVAIGWKEDEEISWKCGGNLIASNFLLTAAHCSTSRGVAPSIVRGGVVNLFKTDFNSKHRVDFSIESIIVHPEYKAPSTYNDIALFQVKPINGSLGGLKPICLWPIKDIITSDLLAMGFGTTSFGGPQANELYVGSLNYIPQDQCKAEFAIRQGKELLNGIIDSQICAQDHEKKRDTCQGDSGGPLQLKADSLFRGRDYLVGITSFGVGCLGPLPGVYTRVHSYLDWIERIVWPEYYL